MPVEMVSLLTLEQFNLLSGMAGVAGALVVIIVWSRGL